MATQFQDALAPVGAGVSAALMWAQKPFTDQEGDDR